MSTVTKQILPTDTTGWDFILTAQPVNRNNPPDKFLDGLTLETSIYVKGNPSQIDKYVTRMTKAILEGINEKYGDSQAKKTS